MTPSLPPDASLYIFDFCGTLFDSNTTLDFIRFALRHEPPLRRVRHAWCRLLAGVGRRVRLLDPAAHMRVRLRALRGVRREALEAAADRFVHDWLPAKGCKDGLDLLAEARRRPSPVLLATCTLACIAEAFARDHGIETVIASTPAIAADGTATGAYDEQLHVSGKLPALRERFGEDVVRGAFFVTDRADADRELLAAVRYPVVLGQAERQTGGGE